MFVALSSIPPRFEGLGPVLEALLPQAPVLLCLPEAYVRFPDWDGQLPSVPAGVEILRGPDHGPASKLLLAQAKAVEAQAGLTLCDDDWIYGAGWLQALEGSAGPTSGQTFDIARILPGSTGAVGQGFAGISIALDALRIPCPPPPPEARAADDIWISGWLTSQGFEIEERPEARPLQELSPNEASPLQTEARAEVYARAARATADHFGIWTKAPSSRA